MAHRKNKVIKKWSAEFAYCIGVITTDGNLSPDLRHIHITSKDLEMITNIKKSLNLDNTIGKKARGGSKEKKYFVLQFGDKNFFDFLVKIGLTPNKSKTLSFLAIPKKYYTHFFRGCIDGDGSISISFHSESKHPQYKLRLCSASKNFLNWIFEMNYVIFNINSGSIHKNIGSSVYTLSYGKSDTVKILKKMYSNDTISLSRKKKIALKIIGQVA